MGQHHAHAEHDARHAPGYPVLAYLVPAVMVVGTVVALWMTERFTRAMEVSAMANVLDELGDRLSDGEKDALASRIRAVLFPPCCR